MKRILPALGLFVLSPLIGEYLLGSVSVALIHLLPILALLYGSAAVTIREVTRRTGRGWPTIFVLAAAYGVLEEAFATQSLFNPHYLGLRLLDYGYLPKLGIGGPWTLYVISLHVIWSICVPIALVELAVVERRTQPWLGRLGFTFFAVLLVLGVVIIGHHSALTEQFMAGRTQFTSAAVIFVSLVVTAFVAFPARRLVTQADRPVPRPWVMAVGVLAAGSAFELLYGMAKQWAVPPAAEVIAMLALECVAILWLVRSSRAAAWSDAHRFGAAAGGLLVYCWWGYIIEHQLHGTHAMVGHTVLVALALVFLVAIARFKLRPAMIRR